MEFIDPQTILMVMVVLTAAALVVFVDCRKRQRRQQPQLAKTENALTAPIRVGQETGSRASTRTVSGDDHGFACAHSFKDAPRATRAATRHGLSHSDPRPSDHSNERAPLPGVDGFIAGFHY
jgi:hypothetical protein